MQIVRIILALLISLSLTLAPGASAFAVMQPSEAAHVDGQMASGMAISGEMSDCMKMMQDTAGTKEKSPCKCCDTKNKCPDSANCMTKCCKVLGAFKPGGKTIALSMIAYRQTEPAKPPEWLRTPPAPPPRS